MSILTGLAEKLAAAALPFPLNLIASGLGAVKSAIGGALSWVAKNPWPALCIALALFAALQRHEATKWHKVADNAQKALSAVPAAQKAALAAQVALDNAKAAQSAQDAKETDNAPQSDIDAAIADYAAAHRVLPKTNCGAASPASTPAQVDASPVDHGPGANAVVLSQDDFATLNANTERLLKAHADGEKLIADGLAVKLP